MEQERELGEEVADMGCKCKAPVTDRLAAYLSAHSNPVNLEPYGIDGLADIQP